MGKDTTSVSLLPNRGYKGQNLSFNSTRYIRNMTFQEVEHDYYLFVSTPHGTLGTV